MLAPPEMPTTYTNNSRWIELCKVDEMLLASYEKKVQSSEHRENYDIPKRNIRYWTTWTFPWQTESPHTTPQYARIVILLKWGKSGES
jgi:hypothetical protein